MTVTETPAGEHTEETEPRTVGGGARFGVALAALVAIVWLLAVILPAAVGR
jgi:hypothetical protein